MLPLKLCTSSIPVEVQTRIQIIFQRFSMQLASLRRPTSAGMLTAAMMELACLPASVLPLPTQAVLVLAHKAAPVLSVHDQLQVVRHKTSLPARIWPSLLFARSAKQPYCCLLTIMVAGQM